MKALQGYMNIWIKKPYQPETEVTLDQVKSDIASGAIDPLQTYCWHEGLDNWVLVSSVITPHVENLQEAKILPPPLPVIQKSDIQIQSPNKKTYRDNKYYTRYSMLCVFLIALALINHISNSFIDRSDASNMRNLGSSFLAICVCRRMLWDLCYSLKQLFYKNQYLYIFAPYFMQLLFLIILFLLILFTRSSPVIVAVFIFGCLASIDIPVRAFNKIKKDLFITRPPYFILWSIYGSYLILITLSGLMASILRAK